MVIRMPEVMEMLEVEDGAEVDRRRNGTSAGELAVMTCGRVISHGSSWKLSDGAPQ